MADQFAGIAEKLQQFLGPGWNDRGWPADVETPLQHIDFAGFKEGIGSPEEIVLEHERKTDERPGHYPRPQAGQAPGKHTLPGSSLGIAVGSPPGSVDR
jgi:hypothetical protein